MQTRLQLRRGVAQHPCNRNMRPWILQHTRAIRHAWIGASCKVACLRIHLPPACRVPEAAEGCLHVCLSTFGASLDCEDDDRLQLVRKGINCTRAGQARLHHPNSGRNSESIVRLLGRSALGQRAQMPCRLGGCTCTPARQAIQNMCPSMAHTLCRYLVASSLQGKQDKPHMSII